MAPMRSAAVLSSRMGFEVGIVKFRNTAAREVGSTPCFSSDKRFAASSGAKLESPQTLPPGRCRLLTIGHAAVPGRLG